MAQRTSTILLLCAALSSIALAPLTFAQQPAPRALRSIVVLVEGLRNNRGTLQGALYTSPSGWLVEGQSAEDCHARVHAGVARCAFSVLAGERVAFAGFHDEDDDGVFDRDFIGMPQEGYTFSNDVREPFGPPGFAAASFAPRDAAPFVVHARYGI